MTVAIYCALSPLNYALLVDLMDFYCKVQMRWAVETLCTVLFD